MSVFPIKRIRPGWLIIVATLLLVILGTRSLARSFDWSSEYRLALSDSIHSEDNYRADAIITTTLIGQDKFKQAKPYAQEAVRIYPNYGEYINLAAILARTGDYTGAEKAYEASLPYASSASRQTTYEGMAIVALLGDTGDANKQIIIHALAAYPEDSALWTYLAIFEDKSGDNQAAQAAITRAASYGSVSPSLQDNIMNNRPFAISLGSQTITIP